MTKIILGTLALLILVVFVAWIRPRVFDEELIFTPQTASAPGFFIGSCKFRDTVLFHQVFDTDKPDFNEDRLAEIKAYLDSHNLGDLAIALSAIEKGLEHKADIPGYMRDKTYLRSKLVLCLKNEVYWLHNLLQENQVNDLYGIEPVNGKNLSDYVTDLIIWTLSEFTFKKNTSLNECWRRIEAFENGNAKDIRLAYGLPDFNLNNYYGEMLVNLVTPSVERFTQQIENIAK